MEECAVTRKPTTLGLSLALGAAVAALYAKTTGFDFLYLDDKPYVYANPLVLRGLSWHTAVDAFVTVRDSYWLPVTWLSFLVDARAFGLDPGAFHRTNLVLHAVNSGLWCWLLARLTGAPWRSAVAATLFALHPMRVESVAWVAERKDLLSGLFFLMGLWAYVVWVRTKALRHYGALLAATTLGAMAKPATVTLPAVLLLLDFWPLARLGSLPCLGHRLREKVPLFALSLGFGLLALWTQQSAIHAAARPFGVARLYAPPALLFSYLGQTVYPLGLAPRDAAVQPSVSAAVALAATLGLAAATAAVWKLRHTAPWCVTAWGWFAVTLMPLCGFVPAGLQLQADRFTYLPHLGLMLAPAWTLGWLARQLPPQLRAAPAWGAVALAAALATATHSQLGHWKNTLALFFHAESVWGPSAHSQVELGFARLDRGDRRAAETHFRNALRRTPSNSVAAAAAFGLAQLAHDAGRLAEAEAEARAALALDPAMAEAHWLLGLVLGAQGKYEEAYRSSRTAYGFTPEIFNALYNTAYFAARSGHSAEAAELYCRVLERVPTDVQARYNRAMALEAAGAHTQALQELREVLRRDPGHAGASRRLADAPRSGTAGVPSALRQGSSGLPHGPLEVLPVGVRLGPQPHGP